MLSTWWDTRKKIVTQMESTLKQIKFHYKASILINNLVEFIPKEDWGVRASDRTQLNVFNRLICPSRKSEEISLEVDTRIENIVREMYENQLTKFLKAYSTFTRTHQLNLLYPSPAVLTRFITLPVLMCILNKTLESSRLRLPRTVIIRKNLTLTL